MRARRAALLAGSLALACGGGEPRSACEPAPPRGELGSVCGFENPEDIAWLPPARLLLVSQMRHAPGGPGGALAALELGAAGEPVAAPRQLWPDGAAPSTAPGASRRELRGDPRCTQSPDAESFAPHGLAAGTPGPDGAIPVAVVAHGAREAVEIFALEGAGASAVLRWEGCVPLPKDAVGNDVWIASDGALWVTRYQPAFGGLRGLFYTVVGGLGFATGEVLRWTPAREPTGPPAASLPPRWRGVPGTRGANPNGLLLAPDESTLAVAYTGSNRIALLAPADPGVPALAAPVPGHPDNLLWSTRGRILAPVHTSGFQALRCRFGALPCRSPWSLVEIDPASGATSTVFAHDGSRLGGVASVAEVGSRLYLGAIFDDRIGVLVR